eukprot:TRINITY_DN20887_c0_g1_i1.p1 TRINITY_DN20887_c0_g1~~TRINITY_DN20887_c0_g1_i1.p1  ORF type:complete len:456 (-),score=98.40 TRINITY_DN20887_c0_g1_i1:633-2000(-)
MPGAPDDDVFTRRETKWVRGAWRTELRAQEAREATVAFSHQAEFPMAEMQASDIAQDAIRVCGLGHPLLDVTALVDESVLKKYNIERGSVGLATEEQVPVFQEVAQSSSVQYVPGGAAMNTMRVARWMLGRAAGNLSVKFIGAVGQDDFGERLTSALEKAQMEPVFHVATGQVYVDAFGRECDPPPDTPLPPPPPTGACAVLVTDKERSMVTNLGAAREVPQSFFHSAQVQTTLKQCDVFYMEGFFFNIISNPETHKYIAALTSGSDSKLFIANISAPFLCYSFKREWKDIIPSLDVIIGNESDWKTFAPVVLGWDGDLDLDVIAARAASMPTSRKATHPLGGRVVIITRGTEPTMAAWWKGPTLRTRQFPIHKVDKEKVVDDCGAGDSFAGGFLAALAMRKPIGVCINAGLHAAAVTVQSTGCQVPDACDFDFDADFDEGVPVGSTGEWVSQAW